ncbi:MULTISPECIES: glycosyltransferase family 2 protein [unclassified Mucilaginibacter]|jgi:cellulose synthase/poly-beta-1,6-N-acetylglucosamine synthase-like glycosyltransferase|uniref:glycosyltransferase n=1 Tax=unclassified Mucilaginibacter TaxID=2617802 RepID=UPI0008D54D51|nr:MULTISPECIES: glycosyltransferase family 2 protein [unclassified Mucilaginibacter]WDF81103.1 glycosyltransferase family 2 protein [Mucilaginibacter sp. KACC 22773]SEP13822.1 Glycosyltransferase, catalytic subunit of cellulose synthase and poly-beta-1,6-N-acetylglucosamine synthase [Mucilaginibacter sp. OK283]
MEIIKFVASVIMWAAFIYLGVYCLYLFIFSVLGKLVPIKYPPVATSLSKFVIYICAYKEDEILLNSAANALTLDYPTDKFHVCVIADSLKPETLVKLRQMPLQVVEVFFENSTKSKALNKAIENTVPGFDAAIVYDIDNVAAPDFLYQINNYLQAGEKVVQGHRIAKNSNTKVAVLDGISEEINNHIFRKAQRVFNLSAAIIGSGMALEYSLFKTTMGQIDAVGGFDKEMGLILTRQKIGVAYAEKAYVYDEKVSNPEVFKKQRKRWLSAQFNLLRKYGMSGFSELFLRGNFDYFNEIYQMSILPRVLMLGLMPFMLFISLFLWWLTPGIGPSWQLWALATLCCYAGILAAIPGPYFNIQLLKAALKLPLIFFTMLLLLFKLKGANKKFIHTTHDHTAA